MSPVDILIGYNDLLQILAKNHVTFYKVVSLKLIIFSHLHLIFLFLLSDWDWVKTVLLGSKKEKSRLYNRSIICQNHHSSNLKAVFVQWIPLYLHVRWESSKPQKVDSVLVHAYWDEDGAPIKWSNRAITIVQLKCACNHAEYFLAVNFATSKSKQPTIMVASSWAVQFHKSP